jgi:heme exporter protein B
MFFRIALLVLKKDFTIEVKSREIVYTTLLFALSCILIFSLTFVVEGQPLQDAAAGIVWIAIAFSGTLALGRTFERERYAETLRALLLAPAPRAAIYVGKLLGILALLFATELLIVPLVALLFQADLFRHFPLLAALLLLGTLGFAAVGTLFAAMLVRARTRDVLLPILLYPITVPVMIAGVRGTAALLQEPSEQALAVLWIGILASFDVVFVTLALWTFEPLMTE